MLHRKTTLLGAAILVSFICVAIACTWITPYDPNAQVLSQRLKPPSSAHWLGTDMYGRDILSRTMFGSRASLVIGLLAVVTGGTVGTGMGLVSGFIGGWTDSALMRVTDSMLSFPTILLALVVVAISGQGGMLSVISAVGIANAPRFARLVRADVLSVKSMDYIYASRALGATRLRLMLHHILPNVMTTILVMASLRVGEAVLTEASLSFLGYGPQPPTITWGMMISESRNFLRLAPWAPLFPAAALVLLVLAFNLVGDGLIEILDPRRRLLQSAKM